MLLVVTTPPLHRRPPRGVVFKRNLPFSWSLGDSV
jgi:hypothetical protein